MKFFIQKATGLTATAMLMATARGGCPFLEQQQQEHPSQLKATPLRLLNERSGDGGVPEGGYKAVMDELEKLLTDSQEFWPADFGNYGPFFIRLAWHCNGSYRESDGRGGCDGGRIRYAPELNWPDNANLDKARELLKPIKEMFGSSLSWGDLISLAGTTAIKSMGGPYVGFCGGRIDDADGSNSLKLGPSDEQESISRCLTFEPSQQGTCNLVPGSPMGPTTVGLIYVNPAGPVTAPGDPIASGVDIRRTFGKMGFNDTETVALIGGGHAFGKGHGACPTPPCGTGKGNDTFSSGFEGQWTDTPTLWTNDYFNHLFDMDWVLIEGPGGNLQWASNMTMDMSMRNMSMRNMSMRNMSMRNMSMRNMNMNMNMTDRTGTTPTPLFMLTTDIALSEDPIYKPISEGYAADIKSLEHDFGHVWYRLMTSDMGPWDRCIGDEVPPPMEFQHTLPMAPERYAPDYIGMRKMIEELLDDNEENYAAFVDLAYRCAFTFRSTDYRGGCNGARIRFEPESQFVGNEGANATLEILKPVSDAYPKASDADLIVLAGLTALHLAGANHLPFCGGRVDAKDGSGSEGLAPRFYEPAVVSIRDDMQVKGLTARQGVALAARPTGSTLSNQFFIDLLAVNVTIPADGNGTLTENGNFTGEELALLEGEFELIVQEFAADEEAFMEVFASAWTYLMTADRYGGFNKNGCAGVKDCTTERCHAKYTDEVEQVNNDGATILSGYFSLLLSVVAGVFVGALL